MYIELTFNKNHSVEAAKEGPAESIFYTPDALPRESNEINFTDFKQLRVASQWRKWLTTKTWYVYAHNMHQNQVFELLRIVVQNPSAEIAVIE